MYKLIKQRADNMKYAIKEFAIEATSDLMSIIVMVGLFVYFIS
jgi:hypothetical protein|tara:strand:+ start:672 stop:800 length:129 start_codon:yes stop_codon:yes gene_type:complete